MIRLFVGLVALSTAVTSAFAADPIEIGIGYISRAGLKQTLSLVDQPAENNGVAGARLAIKDNNTTGRFLNQHFSLEQVRSGRQRTIQGGGCACRPQHRVSSSPIFPAKRC